jgi:RNA methyltransferase, TrmH family
MKLITSRENQSFKDLTKLAASTKFRRDAGQTILDGAHLLCAYLDSGKLPQHIFLNAAACCDDEILALLAPLNNVAITKVDDKLFADISELKTPTGILALIPVIQPTPSFAHFVLLLEAIQDPGNLGSILRSAAAAGCDAVFLSPSCADAWSPKVLRAAMGGHFVVNIYQQQDLLDVAKNFPGQRFAMSLQARHSLYQADLSDDIAFMIGNEGAGLSADLLACATTSITIPMPGKIESLNAAAATAICLFEAVRQRIKS